jgi:hypothetical protein
VVVVVVVVVAVAAAAAAVMVVVVVVVCLSLSTRSCSPSVHIEERDTFSRVFVKFLTWKFYENFSTYFGFGYNVQK